MTRPFIRGFVAKRTLLSAVITSTLLLAGCGKHHKLALLHQ